MEKIIHSLNERTSEIEQIMQYITDISEQTNVLALNAASETLVCLAQGLKSKIQKFNL